MEVTIDSDSGEAIGDVKSELKQGKNTRDVDGKQWGERATIKDDDDGDGDDDNSGDGDGLLVTWRPPFQCFLSVRPGLHLDCHSTPSFSPRFLTSPQQWVHLASTKLPAIAYLR